MNEKWLCEIQCHSKNQMSKIKAICFPILMKYRFDLVMVTHEVSIFGQSVIILAALLCGQTKCEKSQIATCEIWNILQNAHTDSLLLLLMNESPFNFKQKIAIKFFEKKIHFFFSLSLDNTFVIWYWRIEVEATTTKKRLTKQSQARLIRWDNGSVCCIWLCVHKLTFSHRFCVWENALATSYKIQLRFLSALLILHHFFNVLCEHDMHKKNTK